MPPQQPLRRAWVLRLNQRRPGDIPGVTAAAPVAATATAPLALSPTASTLTATMATRPTGRHLYRFYGPRPFVTDFYGPRPSITDGAGIEGRLYGPLGEIVHGPPPSRSRAATSTPM